MITPDQIEKAKELLGIEDKEKDVLVRFSLETAEEIILNYCHIDEVPKGLASTMFRMAVDIYRNEQFGTGEAVNQVSSISVGDTSTSFGGIAAEFSQSLLKNYDAALRRYRRIVF